MGEQSTQLDLSAELDRLAAMSDDDDDGTGPRVHVCDTTIDPERVDGHRLVGLTVETDDPELRGTRWQYPLQQLYREETRCVIDDESVSPPTLIDAVGGPDLTRGYVHDRATGVVSAIAATDDPVTLRVLAAPGGERSVGDEYTLTREALATASRPGFDDGDRYRTYDPVGRPRDVIGDATAE